MALISLGMSLRCTDEETPGIMMLVMPVSNIHVTWPGPYLVH